MVYRGKPSAACGECRKRRSRCDQAVPKCGQCTKAGRICPGYRNTVDLMFHDESKQVVRKNKARVEESSESASAQDISVGSSNQAIAQATASLPVKLTDLVMHQPLDDLGVSYFMANYVGDDPAVSQLYYLPDFYAKIGYAHPGLQQSITAAGLAGYAKSIGRRDMVDIATKSYIAAIRGINAALSDPKTAAQDSTLMSIIMAAMFEVMIIPRISGMQNCTNHLNGAVSVALLNLKQERQTDVTRKLLTTLVQCVIINCWIRHIPLPSNFAKLKTQVGNKVNPNSVHGNFLDIVTELIQFRQALQNKAFKRPMAIIKQALAIDNSLRKFAQAMPEHGQFQAFRVSHQDVEQLAYEGYYHVYPQRFTAHLWNNVRSSRLRLHQVILRQCHILISSSPEDYIFLSVQKAESEFQVANLAVEIAATIPQLAGYLEQVQCYLKSNEQDFLGRTSRALPQAEPGELPRLSRRIGAATIELSSHFIYDPGPFNEGSTTTPTPSEPLMPSFVSPKDELHVDAPAHVSPPVTEPQPASLYHMLFQLYGLRSIPTLPGSLKEWVQGRISWMESNANAKNLSRLQDMLRDRPGDGFPVSDEGYVVQNLRFIPSLLSMSL